RDVIERQTGFLSRLVDDLLDIFRITHGKIKLRVQRLNLEDIVYHAVEDQRRPMEKAGLELTLAAPSEAVWVDGDRTRLSQILSNLLNNALKFTDAGGRVTVCFDADETRAVISVEDTGIGIAPDILPHIFETFAQADTTLDRARGGLGLGLSMVRRLIEMQGGGVEAHSAG